MLGDVGTDGTDKEEVAECILFTYCSPASWPQSQSEVSVESAGAWEEEEEQQTLKASRKERMEEKKSGTEERKRDRANQSQRTYRGQFRLQPKNKTTQQ